MTDKTKQKLISQITTAFADVAYPGDSNIVSMRSAASGEQASIADKLQGKHWSEIPGEDFFWHQASLGMMSPEGFQFYLPAFLIACLVDPDQVDITFSAVLSALSPPPFGTGTEEAFRERIDGLTAEQREAIRSYFAYIQANYPNYLPTDPDESGENHAMTKPWLTDYWSQQGK